jgi:hypothetical protein
MYHEAHFLTDFILWKCNKDEDLINKLNYKIRIEIFT